MPAMRKLPNCLRGMEPLLAVKDTRARANSAEPSYGPFGQGVDNARERSARG
jgi:hypothetical protein